MNLSLKCAAGRRNGGKSVTFYLEKVVSTWNVNICQRRALTLVLGPQQVESPEPESRDDPSESAATAASSLPPQVVPRSLPPQTSPPSLPEMDFFHSDPFTDRKCWTGSVLTELMKIQAPMFDSLIKICR